MSPDLATALRAETPAAPTQLKERVAAIAAATPPPRQTMSVRRALLWGAPAAAAGSLAVAVVVGVITSSTEPPRVGAPSAVERRLEPRLSRAGEQQRADEAATPKVASTRTAATALGPSTNRAQNVQASLRLLVDDTDDLSATTQRALRITRRLGGYVVAVDYGTRDPTEGTASVRVRVPVSRVQAAIVAFNGLGRLLAQQTQITDLQQRLDELTRQIRRGKGDKRRINALRRERIQINRRAAYATVGLALTTHEPEKNEAPPGRVHRAVDDATGILTAELAFGAYALILASPFLVLLAAAFVASRAYRRYADQRLLERA